MAQGPTWAMGAVAAAAAATLIFVLPARAPTVNRARTDPAVSALERWASPMPLASELRESALEALELDSVEEGEL